MEEFGNIVSATPRDSIGSVGFSFSSGGSSMSNSGSCSSISSKTALNECSAAWVNYLNVLNSLCLAGSKLAHTIAVLEQCGNDKNTRLNEKSSNKSHPTSYLINSWNDLARASAVATNTVKSHIMGVLQDFVTPANIDQHSDLEQKRIKKHNELIVLENAQTMINVQHQFCAASYDAFLSLTSCFVCESPVGFPHDQDCTVAKQKTQNDQRSQTPSPNFCGTFKSEPSRGNSTSDQRSLPVGISEPTNCAIEQSRGPSPLQSFRESIPMQAIFENTKGPLPNPGQLLSMKMPFYRSAKSPLSFPLFPLNGQRRWSEAAAGEVIDSSSIDVESQMRRWSMPWEAVKSDQNTVTWNQTRIMPVNAEKSSFYKMLSTERCNSNIAEINWQPSVTSQDGLSEAIHLLSFKPTRVLVNTQSSFSQPVTDITAPE